MPFDLSLVAFKELVASEGSINEAAGVGAYEETVLQVRAAFSSADKSARERVKKLRSEIILRHVLDGEPLAPYLAFADTLDAVLRDGSAGKRADHDWRRAIALIAANARSFRFSFDHEDEILRLNAADVALGTAIRTLRDYGYRIGIEGGNANLAEDVRLRLSTDIDEAVRKIGGQALMTAIMHNLQSTFNHEARRYLLVRTVTTHINEPQPQVPWAYLYQLALKHFKAPSRDLSETAFRYLVGLTTSAVALLGAQPYNGFHSIFLDARSIIGFLQKSVVYDSLFTLPQIPYKHIAAMLRMLIQNSYFGKSQIEGAPMETILQIAQGFLSAAKEDRPLLFSAAELGAKLKKSRSNVANVLDRYFCHPNGSVNAKLTFLPKSTDIDSGFWPLAKIGDEKYWCPPQQFAGTAVLEAIQTALRTVHPKFDEDLGKIIEKFLVEEFRARGIACTHGDYDVGNDNGKPTHGECDLVLETASEILFFEVKKKPLTRIARTGSDVHLLIDMGKGLLDPQLQAMRHERHLVSQGRLKLERKDRTTTEVVLNGREVFRVSVVLMDYGSIHDRQTFQQFMTICCNARFDAVNPADQNAVKEFNQRTRELREIVTGWDEIDDHFPFGTSYFLSVSQIFFLLDAATDVDSFVKELLLTRHIRAANTTDPRSAHR
ncbi:hypothetical protein [Paracidovorax avenae]|uniref:hypothetical protein n=1 Tax=Paracidovorax avenae TaxID=80867 RepID=UPI001AD8355B|nr:hypothetical protein [Paracidovorax avenae]